MKNHNRIAALAFLLTGCILTGCAGQEHPAGESDTMPDDTPEISENAPSSGTPLPLENGFAFTQKNFPRLYGSDAAASVCRSVAAELLGESEKRVSGLLTVTDADSAYRALMNGEAEIVIAESPDVLIWAEKDDGGYDWELSPLTWEDGQEFYAAVNAGLSAADPAKILYDWLVSADRISAP